MGISKYKYYFKKPHSEITKDIFKILAISAGIIIAASSPYFVRSLLESIKNKNFYKYSPKKISSTFDRLKRQGLINIFKKENQFHMFLTEEGKKFAGICQINDLKIKKPKKWDKKWRVVIFDIIELKRMYRELFRGKLKELGFKQLQKSIWIYPYDCQAEIEILRDFFSLSKKELRIILADDIEDDMELRKFFSV